MAREDEHREDLLREATALIKRAEMKIGGFDEPVVAGFRRNQSASFFFGQDIVYQFNSAGELRRAFLGGNLYKANCGRLAKLTRHRTPTAVELIRHDLTNGEASSLLMQAKSQLKQLQAALIASRFCLIGEVPHNSGVVAEVIDFLAKLPENIQVANSPQTA